MIVIIEFGAALSGSACIVNGAMLVLAFGIGVLQFGWSGDPTSERRILGWPLGLEGITLVFTLAVSILGGCTSVGSPIALLLRELRAFRMHTAYRKRQYALDNLEAFTELNGGAVLSIDNCKAVLLVDCENIGTINLNGIPDDVFVPFFFGAQQKSVPTDFLKAALKLGTRFKPVDIEGQGSNALDFHIAFYMGEYLAAHPKASFIILTKDKGFDPLVKHLRGRGFAVRRVESLSEAFSTSSAPAAQSAQKPRAEVDTPAKPKVEKPGVSSYGSVLEFLKTMPAHNRPRKRKALIAHLKSHFAKKISDGEIGNVVNRMAAEKRISENEGKMAYKLW